MSRNPCVPDLRFSEIYAVVLTFDLRVSTSFEFPQILYGRDLKVYGIISKQLRYNKGLSL